MLNYLNLLGILDKTTKTIKENYQLTLFSSHFVCFYQIFYQIAIFHPLKRDYFDLDWKLKNLNFE